MASKLIIYKIIFSSLFALILAIAPIQTQQADAWGASISLVAKQFAEEISNQVNGLLAGGLKQMAIKSLTKNITGFIGGSASQSAKFITNWKDYLEKAPAEKAGKFMNDYLSKTTQGKGSSSNYTPNPTSDSAIAYNNTRSAQTFIATANANEILNTENPASNVNHAQQMVDIAKRTTTDQQTQIVTYSGNPATNIYDARGNFANLNLYLSGINNPWAYTAAATQKYQEALSEEKKVAATESIANQGFISTKEGDEVTAPGKSIGDSLANAQKLGLDAITSAKSVSEVATATVSQVLMQVAQKGFDTAKQAAKGAIKKAENTVKTELKNATTEAITSASKGLVPSKYTGQATKKVNSAIDSYKIN